MIRMHLSQNGESRTNHMRESITDQQSQTTCSLRNARMVTPTIQVKVATVRGPLGLVGPVILLLAFVSPTSPLKAQNSEALDAC
jgi:hypothetical protein